MELKQYSYRDKLTSKKDKKGETVCFDFQGMVFEPHHKAQTNLASVSSLLRL